MDVAEPPLTRYSDALFKQAIEAAPTGMILVDASGRIVLVNAQTERLFGYPRAELVGQSIEVLVPERFRGRHEGHRSGFFANPSPRPMGAGRELFACRKDGTELPVEIGLNPMTTSEGHFVLGSVVDITERTRAARQLEASLHEKELLLRELHHRVKNNLQVISSLLNLQARSGGELAAVLQECRDRVHSIAVVHELLYQGEDLAKVELGPWLEAVAQHLFSTWNGKGGQASLRIDARGSLPVDAAVPCGLIVNELVTNCLKHAFPERPGTVELSATHDAGRVTITVKDAARGMFVVPLAKHLAVPAQRARVLVIDDEALVRQVVARCLGGAHDVTEAQSVADALALVDRGQPFDVILCDLLMPNQTGADFYRVLAERQPGLARRVVFSSGGAGSPADSSLLGSLPNRRLDKPFDVDALVHAVAEVMEQLGPVAE